MVISEQDPLLQALVSYTELRYPACLLVPMAAGSAMKLSFQSWWQLQ